MIRFICILIVAGLLGLTGCSRQEVSGIHYDPEIGGQQEGSSSSLLPSSNPTMDGEAAITAYELVMRRDLLCLMLAYPGFITGIEKKQDGRIYAVMKSGRQILYDDGKSKSFDQKIGNADIQDMMEQVYPLTDADALPAEDFDPGRFRVYALLGEVYGGDQQQIQKKLQNVKTKAGSFLFSGSNRAADAFKAVMDELGPLAAKQNHVAAFVYPMGGTFNYRFIAGTQLLSAHAYGIAVDLVSRKQDYWKWSSRAEGEKRLAAYPGEIARVFEKNGFIWGGKWGHFDIMHYEYRPELIWKARCFSDEENAGERWYGSIADVEPGAREYIQMIDEAFAKTEA